MMLSMFFGPAISLYELSTEGTIILDSHDSHRRYVLSRDEKSSNVTFTFILKNRFLTVLFKKSTETYTFEFPNVSQHESFAFRLHGVSPADLPFKVLLRYPDGISLDLQ